MFLLTGLFLALQQGDWGHPSCVCHHRTGHFSSTPVWPKCYISSHSHGYKHFLFHHTATIYPLSPPQRLVLGLHVGQLLFIQVITYSLYAKHPAVEVSASCKRNQVNRDFISKGVREQCCSQGPDSHNRLKKSREGISSISTPSDCFKKGQSAPAHPPVSLSSE